MLQSFRLTANSSISISNIVLFTGEMRDWRDISKIKLFFIKYGTKVDPNRVLTDMVNAQNRIHGQRVGMNSM